jgi:hypothetical protein
MGGETGKHGGNNHDSAINKAVDDLPKGAKNVRKNQAQVDADGNVFGDNRPDLQYDLDGVHYNVEFDNDPWSAGAHGAQIFFNDPDSVVTLVLL